MRTTRVALAVAGLFALVFMFLAIMVSVLQTLPTGPREVIWDKQPCKECGMSVSDRDFACQLQALSGDIYDFDDPGCLFQFILRRKPDVKATYFRGPGIDEWISGEQVGFVSTDRSPMAYGFAAVTRKNAEKALSLQEAIEEFRKLHFDSNARGR